MHKISPGASDKSYGIHVARIAEMPDDVTNRAKELLLKFETHGTRTSLDCDPQETATTNSNLPHVHTSYMQERLIDKLRNINVNELSPIQALVALSELKEEAGCDGY